jgi:hypothetical protein
VDVLPFEFSVTVWWFSCAHVFEMTPLLIYAFKLLAINRYAGMLRLVSEILPRIESAKQCDVTVEICKGGAIS